MTAIVRQSSREAEPPIGVLVATRDLVRTAMAASPRRVLLVFALSFVRGVLPAAIVAVLAAMIDQVARLVLGDDTAAHGALLTVAIQAALQVSLILVSEGIRVAQRRLELLIRFEIERRLMLTLLNIEVQELENPTAYARVARLRSGGQTGVSLFNGLVTGFVALVTLGSMLLLTLRIHPALSLLLLVIVGSLLALQVRAGRDRFARGLQVQGAEVRASYWFNLLTNPLAALDLRAYQLGPWIQERWGSLVITAAEEGSAANAAQDRMGSTLQVIGVASSIGLSAMLLWLASARMLTIGSFVATGAILVQTVSATQQLGQSLGAAVEAALGHADLLRFGATRVVGPPVAQPRRTFERQLDIEQVTFQYAAAAVPALRNVSCTVRRGERVLLVGPNGAGKSTFVKVVAGLYSPQIGRVLYDGVDLVNSSASAQIASLLQGYLYYDTTVSENIALGDVGQPLEHDSVAAAARMARIDDTIRSWPLGYQSGLGRWLYRDGVIPSQGQRVRLALARTFYRHAALYVLDEPTAGLDPAAANEIAAAIDEQTRGKTALIVSHDLDLWPFVDRVLVFERGEIVADGPRSTIAGRADWLAALIGPVNAQAGELVGAERPYWS